MKRIIKFRAYTEISNEVLGMKYDVSHNYNDTVMQFTGLLDKNSKEIYEGDICKDDVGHFMEIKFGELPLDKGGDCVCTYQSFYAKDHGKLGETPYYECNQIGNWFEIIGNIYENPDLLSSHPLTAKQ